MHSVEMQRETLTDFAEACRRAGIAATAQRRLIYAVLASSEDHPTADEVHERVRRRRRGISLATVYRNLKLFAEAGLIEEVATGSSFARYDANRAVHHHLVCTGCGRVSDTYDENLPTLAGRRALEQRADGFEVYALRVNLMGLCRDCSEARGRRPA